VCSFKKTTKKDDVEKIRYKKRKKLGEREEGKKKTGEDTQET
jgi:hypothetical protein